MNLPVGAAALLVLTRVADSPRRERRFDWTGQITAVLALGGLTFGIIEGGRLGYGATPVLVAFVIAAVAAVAFVVAQAKGRQPMVPLGLFSSRAMSTGLSIAAITMAAFYGVVFVQSLYFQQQRGQSALITGLLFLPMTGMVAALNPIVARAMQRRGLLPTTIAGIMVMAGGLGALCLLPARAPVWLASLLMVPVGVGGSFTVPPLTALVMGQIPAERAGTASGVLNTARQTGGSLGVAVFGAVIATQASFISGLRLDFGITALLLILAAGAALRLRPSERTNTKLAPTERTPCNT